MCGCRSGRKSTYSAAGKAVGDFKYQVTLPGEDQPQDYLTAIEARVAVRKAGGGNIRRVAA